MKTLQKRALFLLLMLALCLTADSSQIEFIKNIEFSEAFYAMKLVVTDQGLFVWVDGDWSIILCDFEGKVVKRFARIGEGPGELRFLSDFAVGEHVVAAGDRKICSYQFSGALVDELKSNLRVYKLFLVDGDILFQAWNIIVDPQEKRVNQSYHLCDSQNRLRLELPDESKQRAVNPTLGAHPPLPWFPSPFYNRPVIVPGKDGDVAVFMTRERSFRLVKKDRTISTHKIGTPLKGRPVTNMDKTNFFTMIQPKPAEITKQSVVFPETKGLFSGVIRWGDGWALVMEDVLVILSYNGQYKETIALPQEIKHNDVWEVKRPARFLCRHRDRLYIIHNHENISVFQLK